MNEKYTNEKNYKRIRCKYVNFRVTPKEAEELDKYVALSGLLKQEYLVSKVLNRDVVVKGNPRVFKVLTKTMNDILNELRRINDSSKVDIEFREFIKHVADLCRRLNE